MGLKGLMSRSDWARLTLLDVEDAVAAEARRLDPDTDLHIALTHIGLDDDRRLASAVPSLDLIVGGHSHTRLPVAEEVAGVRIVQAGSYARSLGVVDLRVEDDRIASFEYTLRDLDPAVAPVPPSRRLVELTEGYQRQIDSYYGQKVSNAPALLGRDYHHESALGRWITDALRESAGADVAFYNGGGLRADLPAGPVTKGTLYACFPFKNEVRTFELTGEELTRIFLRNAIAENDEKRGFVSISGVRYVWRVRNGAPEVVTATVGGAPLDPARTYTAVTTSYIAEQWEKNLGVEPRNLQGTGRTDFDAAVEHAARGEVVAPTDARAVRER
jgi:2',3'-cyclic-nucleotide 2'-phosphodiesterase (5'-nucleotidase family)